MIVALIIITILALAVLFFGMGYYTLKQEMATFEELLIENDRLKKTLQVKFAYNVGEIIQHLVVIERRAAWEATSRTIEKWYTCFNKHSREIEQVYEERLERMALTEKLCKQYDQPKK